MKEGLTGHLWFDAGGSGGTASLPGGVQGQSPCKNPTHKYYYAGAQRVAMRENGTLSYLLADHLGSTSITASSSGAKVAELRYNAWGDTRYTWGTTPTTFRYTGQREQVEIGLYYYGARWYDPSLARFTQPDSIVPSPGEPQSLNRFSYTKNSPLRYTDPTGHAEEAGVGTEDAEGLSLISLEELLNMEGGREAAVEYLAAYVYSKYGLRLAEGVSARYMESDLEGDLGVCHVASGPDDPFVTLYGPAFEEAENSADVMGIVFEEVYHSRQEQIVETKLSIYRRETWETPANPALYGAYPAFQGKEVYEGQRYIPAMEVEVNKKLQDLQAGGAGFSRRFMKDVGYLINDVYQPLIDTYPRFCLPATPPIYDF